MLIFVQIVVWSQLLYDGARIRGMYLCVSVYTFDCLCYWHGIVCIKRIQDHYLFWNFLCILYVKNSCGIVYFIQQKKYSMAIKKNDSIFSYNIWIMKMFSIFRVSAYSELWIHTKTQAFIIHSKAKQSKTIKNNAATI